MEFRHFSTCLGTRSLPSTTAVTNSLEYSMASSLEEKQEQEEANSVSFPIWWQGNKGHKPKSKLLQPLGICFLWKNSLISKSHGPTIPLHMTLDIAGNSHFPIVWEWRDTQGRYPMLLRLQCRMKYSNIWENSDGNFLQQPDVQDIGRRRKKIKISSLNFLEIFPTSYHRQRLPHWPKDDPGHDTSQDLPRDPGVEVWSRRLYNSPEISSSVALWLQKTRNTTRNASIQIQQQDGLKPLATPGIYDAGTTTRSFSQIVADSKDPHGVCQDEEDLPSLPSNPMGCFAWE